MAHVSNPNVAGPSSSLGGGGGGSSSSKKAIEVPSWPESIQVRLKELEAEFDDEEITKKGFWKQKYKLVETFLTKNQIKDVAALHEDYKSGNVTDVDYFKKLAGLLAPVETCIDEGVKDEDEAMICEESPETVKAEKAPSGSLGDAEELPSESSYKSKPKKDKNRPLIMAMFKKATEKKEDNEKKRKSSKPEDNTEKKIKTEDHASNTEAAKVDLPPEKVSIVRCGTCRQLVDSPDTIRYESHPQGAVEEFIGMSDQKLSLFEEGDYVEESMPQYKLTGFTVYDKAGHVVPFDTGLIDKNKEIFFSGYLKHLTCEDPSIEEGVPVFDCGPINSWWNAGFDGGEKALTGPEVYILQDVPFFFPSSRPVNEFSSLGFFAVKGKKSKYKYKNRSNFNIFR